MSTTSDSDQRQQQPIIPPSTFEHQVAGHAGTLFKLTPSILAKPISDIELEFYQKAQGTPIESFLPKWHGTCEVLAQVHSNETLSQAKKDESAGLEGIKLPEATGSLFTLMETMLLYMMYLIG
jgi:hypothetical protein